MQVDLIAYTQQVVPTSDKNPLSIAELAASVCYDSEPTETYRIAKGCKATGHRSVLEHISFTFHVTGVSRALLAQLSRHRHISLSVRSQRYCSEDNFDYVNPFGEQHGGDVFDDMMSNIANDYKLLKNLGAANEDARAVLPNACCTELYVTINARSLIEMSHLRLCTRAQAEIRSMFQLIKEQVATVCPELAAWMVPSCEANPKYPFCPEGNRCCGRHPKLADVYKSVKE
mgnify:FL=1